jgi:hypothetical protein
MTDSTEAQQTIDLILLEIRYLTEQKFEDMIRTLLLIALGDEYEQTAA